MNQISLCFFAVAILILATQIIKGADIISPARVFGFTWSVVFGITSLKFSGLQSDWTALQWIYAVLGPISFLVGLFISFVLNLSIPLLPISQIRQSLRHQRINDDRLFKIISILFWTYLAGYGIIWAVKGYVPILAFNPSAARIEYFIFGVGVLIHHMPLIVIFSLLYHIVVVGNRRKKLALKIMAGVTIIMYFGLLQRYQLIMISVMAFTILYYFTNRVRFRTVVYFVSGGIGVVYSIASLRVGQIVATILYASSKMRFSPRFAMFTEPYMYIAMNLENFVRAADRHNDFTFGYYTFDFMFALTGLKYPIQKYFNLIEYPFLTSGYNTYTLFWTFYRDFGILGISIIPLIFGMGVGQLYYSLRQDPTIPRAITYGVILFVMALSFFLSPLGFLWFAYIMVWMVMIFHLVCLPRTN